MSYILETRSVTKEYIRGAQVLQGVDMHVERGSIYGLLGKEGSGKSTLLKILAGHSYPTSGEVIYPDGRPVTGTLIELPGIFPNLTVADHIAMKMKSMGRYSKDALEAHLERTGMALLKELKIRVFSRNLLKKLGISLALAGDPELVILDEPFADLDRTEIEEARKLILSLKENGQTVIVTAPMLSSLTGLADTYGVLENGRVIREDEEGHLSSHLPGHIVLRTNDLPNTKLVLESLGIFAYQTKNSYTIHIMEQLDRTGEIIQALVSEGIQVYECAVVREASDEFYFAHEEGGTEA